MADMTDDDILAELGVDLAPKKARARTPREERIIAGFEDIVRFFETHGRPPQHGEDRDIFERLYAVRLDRLRDQADCRELIREMDRHGLLEWQEEASAEYVRSRVIEDGILRARNEECSPSSQPRGRRRDGNAIHARN